MCRFGWVVAVTAVLFALPRERAVAQARLVRGTVVDEAGKGLRDARVFLHPVGNAGQTAKDGTFSIEGTGTEPLLAVRLPGYVPVVLDLRPGGGEIDAGTVTLRKVRTDADQFAVQVVDIRLLPQLAKFYDHKQTNPAGTFLGPDDIARHKSARLIDVARRTGGMQRMCFVTGMGQLDCGAAANNRGPTTIMNQPAADQRCAATLWYYGIGPNRPTFDEIRMDDVLAIEAYERQGAAPPEFSGRDCAIVVLWMRPAGP